MPLLGQPDASIYENVQPVPWPGQAPQGRQAGPNAAMARLGLEEQENEQIRQLAQQYGTDYDGLADAVTQINPKRGMELRSALESSRKEAAARSIEETKGSIQKLDMGARWLQTAAEQPDLWPVIRGELLKQAGPQGQLYDKVLPQPGDPELSDKLTKIVTGIALPTKDYLETKAKASQLYFDGKKVEGALTLMAGSKTPEQWQHTSEIVKGGGLGKLLETVQTPEAAQAMLTSQQQANPTAEKTGSDYHQYAVRWAKEHGTTFEQMTTKQEQQARKEYGQADDRPRASVTVQMPAGGANNPDVKYWADQIQKDPTIWNNPLLSGKGNEGLRTAIAHEIATRGGDLDKLTAQTKQMGETAKAILPHISTIEQEAKALEARGLMGPLGSRWREFVSGTLKATELATNADDAKLIGKFQADLGLLRSAVARAHGGARGGGSPTMIEHMKTIIQGGGDFPTFQGSLSAVKDWMQTYTDEARLGAQVPSQVKSLLSSKGPGNYTFSDGSKWRKDANGNVTKVQ